MGLVVFDVSFSSFRYMAGSKRTRPTATGFDPHAVFPTSPPPRPAVPLPATVQLRYHSLPRAASTIPA